MELKQSHKARSNPDYVQQVMEGLYPNPATRQAVARCLAESIELAHEEGHDSWEITLHMSGWIRLNVGQIIALDVRRDPRVSLANGTLDAETRKKLAGQRDSSGFSRVRDVYLFRFDTDGLISNWPATRAAHAEAIRRAVADRARSIWTAAHSPGVVVYLERELGRKLPRPGYEEAALGDPIAALVARVQARYPGWNDFSHQAFVKDELDYKQQASAEAKQLLGRAELETLAAQGTYPEILERFRRVARSTNLLFLRVPRQGDLALLEQPDVDLAALCRALIDLLHGEGDAANRIGRFWRWTVESRAPGKWPFATYFLWLCAPESEVFVKPSRAKASARDLSSDIDLPALPTEEAYVEFRELMHSVLDRLRAYGAHDMLDVQSFLWVATQESGSNVADPDRRKAIEALIPEFAKDYLPSRNGQRHLEFIATKRDEFRASFVSILLKRRGGEDVTGDFLLKLLPHGDFQGNRARGAWIHWAPAITKDARTLFENAGWVAAKNWPAVVEAALTFFEACDQKPSSLEDAARHFEATCPGKGLQAGMLSPGLNALRPREFVVYNSKSRRLINYLAKEEFGASLTDYGAANECALALIEELAPALSRDDTGELVPADTFDVLCHWLIAEKGFDFGDRKYWKIAPGENAKLWSQCRDQGHIALGWNDLGDVAGLSREEFQARRAAIGAKKADANVDDADQVWRFSRIAEGDRVLANNGTREVLGIGTVIGPYYFEDGERYPHRLKVRWDDTVARSVNEPGWRRTLIRLDEEKFARILGLPTTGQSRPPTPPQDEPPPEPVAVTYTLANLTHDTGLEEDLLRQWIAAIQRKRQAIVYGPPGTGKTYVSRKLARFLTGGDDRGVDLVQFHPAYAYEDFIQGIRPVEGPGGQVSYRLEAGRFLEFCKRAASREGPSVLIIDEINRANLARVLGELMYLLEYREEEMPLSNGGRFKIPDKVLIIGTMNTADRSIALVDHALRRRFAFLELAPTAAVLRRFHAESSEFDTSGLEQVLEEINVKIGEKHFAIGISFFLDEEIETNIEMIWTTEIEPYLEEYFFDQPKALDEFRWAKVKSIILGAAQAL